MALSQVSWASTELVQDMLAFWQFWTVGSLVLLSSSERSEPLAESKLRVAVDSSSVGEVNTASPKSGGVFAAASNKA